MAALAEKIRDLLQDRLTEVTEFICIEPDFRFILRPRRDLRKDPNVIRVRKGHEFEDAYMEWKVFLWNEGLTDNHLTVRLGLRELECLLVYLRHVMGIDGVDSLQVKQLMAEGILIP